MGSRRFEELSLPASCRQSCIAKRHASYLLLFSPSSSNILVGQSQLNFYLQRPLAWQMHTNEMLGAFTLLSCEILS